MIWSYTKGMIKSPETSQPGKAGMLNTEELVRPTASLPPIDSKHYITTMSHAYQKLNNCGPVTASMAASTLGVTFDQFFAAGVLKGGPSDKNVSAHEMQAFLESQGLKVVYRLNGNPQIIEQLIAHDIPVIVEQWLVKRGEGELVGHYRAVRGYDQKAQVFTTNDSFNGPNFVIPYTQFDQWWRPFNRSYLVVYKSEQEEVVRAILQTDWESVINWEDTAKVAQAEIKSIGDGYSYFNLGTAYTRLHKYSQAASAYDSALKLPLPDHFLWYEFGPLEAYYQMGQYDELFRLTDELLRQAGEVEEARYYRSLAYTKQGKLVEARLEQDKMSAANPRFTAPFK
jgi:tetratricopeptide (TPR) repeat protein